MTTPTPAPPHAEAPAATVRRAAAVIRDTATAATPSPWVYVTRHSKGPKGSGVLAQVEVHMPPLPGSNIPEERRYRPSRAGDARYAVMTQPRVGLLLADLMLEVAESLDQDGAPIENATDRAVLALALQVLGEQK